jgi:ketosteroid isomerase-like protein
VRFLPYVRATAFVVVGAVGHDPVLASEASDVTSRVQQLVEHFNKGDLSGDMADTLQVVDDFPPFFWDGKNALAEWDGAYVGETKLRSIVKTSITLEERIHVEVRDDHAYVVVRAISHFMHRNGGQSREWGTLTLALTKTEQSWKVSALTWSRGTF